MEKKKSKFISFIDNLWYHEKAKIIIFFVLAAFLIISISQCASNKTPDIYLLYAGDESVPASILNACKTNMKDFIPEDYNKDGSISSVFQTYRFQDELGTDNKKLFDNEIIYGNTVILFLSPKNFEYCLKQNYIVSLKDALGYLPSAANNNYSIEFFDLECATEMGLSLLPEDTLVCVAAPNNTNAKTNEYNNQIEFLKYMIEWQNQKGE